MDKHIDQLSVQKLFAGSVRYRIPMYQRNYAWEEGEITQLIQDVIDYSDREQHYYIGTLVVFKRPDANGATVYETIDGQQRLTTISLLVSYLKNKGESGVSWYNQVLDFECREHSQQTCRAIFDNRINELSADATNSAILNGYRIIQKVLPQKLMEHGVSEADFSSYLFKKVQIMRVTVPHDTELNHYFEIMNNRGEQLEKHEVLKPRLLEVMNRIPNETEREKSKNCFHCIWKACANMEKYVQAGFTSEQQHKLFGCQDWGQFLPQSFDDVQEIVSKSFRGEGKDVVAMTLTDILSHAGQADRESSGGDEEVPERFNSVINFPNFLLHVLRVSTREDIPLDDKRLIAIFEEKLLKKGDPGAVKNFGFALLKCKYLYDHYILKREFIRGTDGWSLKRYKWSDGGQKKRSEKGYYVNTFDEENGQDDINRQILMLLAAFHVSTPTLVYKHWLNAALNYLYREGERNQNLYGEKELCPYKYKGYLQEVARAFVFDRFLGGYSESEYYQIIYERDGKCNSQPKIFSDANLDNPLSFGNIENNLVFNYLDYLLWLNHKKTDTVIRDYEFTFRSSVEHYYPQHPLPGHDTLEVNILNSFGNLCLISHSKNSRLSNFMPQAKKEYYQNNAIDSIKQYLMMQEDSWDEQAITKHAQAMRDVFRKDLERS